MRYITCACGERVYLVDDKYFCTKCNKEIKPKSTKGWGGG